MTTQTETGSGPVVAPISPGTEQALVVIQVQSELPRLGITSVDWLGLTWVNRGNPRSDNPGPSHVIGLRVIQLCVSRAEAVQLQMVCTSAALVLKREHLKTLLQWLTWAWCSCLFFSHEYCEMFTWKPVVRLPCSMQSACVWMCERVVMCVGDDSRCILLHCCFLLHFYMCRLYLSSRDSHGL